MRLTKIGAAVSTLMFAGCVATGGEDGHDEDLGETEAYLSPSDYRAASISESGDLITYTGPYIFYYGYNYKLAQRYQQGAAATKFCTDQGHVFYAASYGPASGTHRIALASTASGAFTFTTQSYPSLASSVTCQVVPPPPPPPPDEPVDPCNGCWDY